MMPSIYISMYELSASGQSHRDGMDWSVVDCIMNEICFFAPIRILPLTAKYLEALVANDVITLNSRDG